MLLYSNLMYFAISTFSTDIHCYPYNKKIRISVAYPVLYFMTCCTQWILFNSQ